MRSANFAEFIPLLSRAGIRYIVIGGGAGLIHGLARATFDVDIVYARDVENLTRIVEALKPHTPYLRGAPPGLPFRWEVRTLEQGLNFTLTTTLGDIDILGEVAGGGRYEQLLPHTVVIQSYGFPVHYVTLERLIVLKRAAGRPKDYEMLAQLEALLEERNKGTD